MSKRSELVKELNATMEHWLETEIPNPKQCIAVLNEMKSMMDKLIEIYEAIP